MSFPLLLHATVLAAPPLVVSVDEAEAGLRAWWRDGELIVAPPDGDPRPAIRPLRSPAPVALPPDRSGWTDLLARCSDGPPIATMPVGDATATAEATTDTGTGTVRLTVRLGERLVAEGALGRPAKPCSLYLGQADALPGYELLLGWRTAAGLRGLTVFRVPEMALDPMVPGTAVPSP